MAFQPSSGEKGGMSIDIQKLIEKDGLDPKIYVIVPPFIGAVRFITRDLREEDLLVGFEPLEENPYHGEVWGKFNKAKQNRMCVNAEEFVIIEETRRS